MASARLVVWTGRGLQCLKCDQEIEAREGNMELAVNLHMEAHRNLESTTKQETEILLPDTSSGKIQLDSSYSCPVCKENVEIKYNDVKLSLKLHAMKHQGTSDTRPDEQLSNISGKSKNSSKKKNKEEAQLVDKLSNSSSGKSKQSNKKNNKEPAQPLVQNSESTILDDIFNAMPLGLKAHRGFIIKNGDGKTDCNVCNLPIENTLSISEHLKTKSHEDNAITFLKKFISKDLFSELDFVSFYGSNLCCNLCKCKIDLCSKNPHETIVNIMIHNAQKTHVKSNCTSYQSDDISALLQSLSQINPVIKENKDYVNVKMQPQISCNLCNKLITYDKDETNFLKNFNGHFTSAGHVKCKEVASVLKVFNKLNLPGQDKHKFTPAKGNVHCSRCECTIEPDVKKLELHVKSSYLTQSGENAKLSFSKQIDEALKMDNASLQNSATSQQVSSGEALSVQCLLQSMPAQFHSVNYIVLSNKNQVSCLLCYTTIPATHHNLKTHLMGNKHRKSEEKRQTETMFTETSAALSGVDGFKVTQIIDKFFNALIKKDPVMASHESVLQKFEDGKHYLCNLCGFLIPSSQDLNKFRASLYSHVQSERHKHLYSLQNQSNPVNTLNKEINKVSLPELFEALPLSLGSEQQFIKVNHNEANILFCTACKVKVPARVQFLQDHLQGAPHAVAVKKLNSGLVQKLAGLSMDNTSSQDTMVHQLMTTDKVIKSNAKYIVKKGEDYFCTLCQATIKQAYEPQVLKDNFLSHFTGQKHLKSLDKVVSDLLDKLLISNPVVKTEQSFMRIQNKTVYCTLCSVAMPSGVEEGPFMKNIASHFAGSKHQSKKNTQLPTKPLNQPAKTSQPIRPRNPTNNPFFSGHNSTSNHPSYFQPPVLPLVPTRPFMGHQQNVPLMDQRNMYANPDTSFNNNFNLIAESFKTVPDLLKSDVKYITTGPIEGYLTCILCNNTINPHYLNSHLLEAKHIQERQACERQQRFKQNI